MLRASFVVCLMACGGGDSPPVGDAPVTPGDTAADSPPAACATPGECPCFSNDDCPEGTRCHAETPKDVYCEPGARGTAMPGEACTGENDCDSALCVEGDNDVLTCSRTCTDSNQCPAELPRCIAGIGICARQI